MQGLGTTAIASRTKAQTVFLHTALSTTEVFLIAIGIIFTVPYLIWRVCRTDYYAPLVVVQIITGILLGPGILGKIYPEYYAFVFSPAVVQSLNGIAWWGVMVSCGLPASSSI